MLAGVKLSEITLKYTDFYNKTYTLIVMATKDKFFIENA